MPFLACWLPRPIFKGGRDAHREIPLTANTGSAGMFPGMQGSVPGMQVIRRVYPRGGHEWPPFLLVVILMLDPVLPGAEMTRQQLFMSVINRTKLSKTILMISPGATWKEVAFARSCTPDTIKHAAKQSLIRASGSCHRQRSVFLRNMRVVTITGPSRCKPLHEEDRTSVRRVGR